jgi:hypothetical protein
MCRGTFRPFHASGRPEQEQDAQAVVAEAMSAFATNGVVIEVVESEVLMARRGPPARS